MYLVYHLNYLKIARFAEICRNGYEILKIKFQFLLMGYFSVVFFFVITAGC